jgi:hypothetical protein
MKNLTFDNGIVEYDLGGKVTVRFNPTDVGFIEKLFESFASLDRIQEEIRQSKEEISDEKKVYRLAKNLDTRMREIINALFGQDVCTPLFGEMNLFASAGGLPVWANLMLAIAEEVETCMQGELKQREARIKKYTEKYRV